MEITQVRVFPVDEEKLRAFVSIVIDDCFVVSDIKIIQGTSGLFVSMPSKKRKNGTFRDIAHPLNNETRRHLEDTIIATYKQTVAEAGEDDSTPVRSLLDENIVSTPEAETRDEPAADAGTMAEATEGEPRWP